ncbi:Zona pellucida sperm-binding protein 4 [Liparis tanakae]|uniref:Zona pellucida sperm-binding protein 4 n=1 Tax=Liparis tanakae TaxID=230148 RepID=A0A4Z2FES3_9TELE|nr:Zona pellucida sperm-binding protein 4 [Liparis tanakae]
MTSCFYRLIICKKATRPERLFVRINHAAREAGGVDSPAARRRGAGHRAGSIPLVREHLPASGAPGAMKLMRGCVLAVALLGCLAGAQYPKQIPQQRPPLPQQRPPQVARTPGRIPDRHSTYPERRRVLEERPPRVPERPQTFSQTSSQSPRPHPSDRPLPDRMQHCFVSENDRITCGAPGITGPDCKDINCCFDGSRCYYGKLVTLQCTKDAQIIVVVARDTTIPNIDLESIHFQAKGDRCKPVGVTSAFAIYQFPVTACGTSLKCKYIGTSVQSVVVEVGKVPEPLPVAAFGPLDVELRVANGQCTAKGCLEEDVAYNSFYVDSDYPVTKTLRDPVYVEVRMLKRTDPNLVLTLGRCWVTSKPDPQSMPQWDLLVDGCPYSEDRYRTLTIHCETAVCRPGLGYDCERTCNRKSEYSGRDVAASGLRGSREETVLVSSKQIVITGPTGTTFTIPFSY